MRFARPEPDGAENAGDVRRVVLLQPVLRQHALVNQPLERQHPDDVRLGFFEPRVQAADRLSDVHLAAVSAGEGRSEAVTDLVHYHGGQIALGGRAPRLPRVHDARRQRQDDFVDARVHEVLEEDLLRALLLVNTRIVGQVVGDRLVSVAEVARPERRVHHFHRRHVAAHRRPVRLRQRQGVLNLRHPLLILREVLAFRLVPDEHGRAVRRFHPQQVVEIRLVRREDHVELRILQVEPRDVTRVVLVGEQRVGAHPQEAGELRVGRERRRLTQCGGGAGHERFERVVIPEAGEIGALTPHEGVPVVDLGFLRRMAGHIGFDLRAREVRGIDRVSRRHGSLPDERAVLVHEIPTAAVDGEVAPYLARQRPLIAFQLLIQREPFGVALPPVHALEVPARDDQLVNHLPFARTQARCIERHPHRLESSQPLIQIRYDIGERRRRGQGLALRHHGRRDERGCDHHG